MQKKPSPSLAERFEQWKAENPLRRWRKQNKLGLATAASLLDVSVSSVRQWEAGVNMPEPESMEKLRAGLHDPDLEATWAQWFAQKRALLHER